MNTVLRCNEFSFSLAGVSIIDGINFSLKKGEYLSIIGPNGSGKSTLLKCLLRLHEGGQSRGQIQLLGQPITKYSQRDLARHMAYVPQAGGRIPPFTVAEFLKLSRYPYSAHRNALSLQDKGEVTRALELTDMQGLAHKNLATLSGGERQRAFLAAALAQGTDVLLLDEPASFLDPRHAAGLNALLKYLNRQQGMTIITVTHDLNHPLDAGGQVLVLRHGWQAFFGPSSQLAIPGILEAAFEHRFTYLKHPTTGKPLVLAEQC